MDFEKLAVIKMTIPDIVRQMMDRFSGENHESLLVGGAVRDTLLGQPIKDYDILVSVGYQNFKVTLDYWWAILSRLYPDLSDDGNDPNYEGFAAWTFNHDGVRVNLILTQDPLTMYINNFSCDLSKVWADIDGTVTVSDDARYCADSQVLVFPPYANPSYVQKMCKKFPSWKPLVVTKCYPDPSNNSVVEKLLKSLEDWNTEHPEFLEDWEARQVKYRGEEETPY